MVTKKKSKKVSKTSKKTSKKKISKKVTKSKKVSKKKISKKVPIVQRHVQKRLDTGELIRINHLASELERSKLRMALKDQDISNIRLRIKILKDIDLVKKCTELDFRKKAYENTKEDKRLKQVEYELAQREHDLIKQKLENNILIEKEAVKQQSSLNSAYMTCTNQYDNYLQSLIDKYKILNNFGYHPITGIIHDIKD